MRFWPKWLRREVEETRNNKDEAKQKLEQVEEQWVEVHEVTRILRARDDQDRYVEALRRVFREHGITG
jgi:hypothetical protein